MLIVIKRKTLTACLATALFFAAVLCFVLPPAIPTMAGQLPRRTIVIDAGHGGEDGGAVSRSGVAESGINLAIARRLDQILTLLGEDTVMTRTDERAVYSSDAGTLRQKKASDLRNRVSAVNAMPGAILISIHQNSLPSVPSVHGAQVFFGTREFSAAYAQGVQSALNRCVNNGNAKQEKPIDPTIYLMKNVNCPAILVECGFLSNEDETTMLQDASYQKKLAISIAAGFLCAAGEEQKREVP